MKKKLLFILCFVFFFELLVTPDKGYATSSKLISVKAGYEHVLGLRDDGTVWAWGENYSGQLGDGTNDLQRDYPKQVVGLTNIIAIDAGTGHSVALKNDGTVWTWGNNTYGQLGDGNTIKKNAPIQISLTNIVSISCGSNFTLALKSDGTVWSWGDNKEYQLGIGNNASQSTPVQVLYASNVISISAGQSHALALKSNGELLSWGENEHGECGNNSTSLNRTAPGTVMNGIAAIDTGEGNSYAITNDGTILGWGSNSKGQLGLGTYNTYVLSPTVINGISDIKSVTGGYVNTVALKSDGTVWASGFNNYGQLGDGHIYGDYPDYRTTFAQINGINGAVSVACGHNFTVVLLNDGSVWGCGINNYSQLGK